VENQKTIVKNKSFIMKPMDPGEAVLQMELVDHNFFVFLNGETNDINVVYKRRDGDYGLIEPE
jgi:putative sigma-54 modulation protein